MKKIAILLTLLLLISCVPLIVRDCVDCIAEKKIGEEIQKEDTVVNPAKLSIRIYRDNNSFTFPEEELPVFNRELGIAISGGGFRSYSCAIGQVRALQTLGIMDTVGMLSVLSGSSWFSAPFMFAPDSLSDDTLFRGDYTKYPSELTLESLSQIEHNSLGYPITQLSNQKIIEAVCESAGEGFPGDRLFNSILREFLSYFQLGDKHSFVTWDEKSKDATIKENPALKGRNFYTVRKDRPFLAISSTIYDSAYNKHHKMHHFETTPLYVGTAQKLECTHTNNDTFYLGGGYIENIGFNSKTPLSMFDSTAVVPFPEYQYALFDMVGTSGSAPGSIFDHLHIYGMMSGYNYWPLEDSIIASENLSFVDGGDYENMALVPLLRRGVKKIIAFDNVDTKVGSKDKSYKGISYDIARLFGHKPKHSIVNSQTIQIFPSEEFDALVAGIDTTLGVPYYKGTHTILTDNPFDLDSGSVEILWICNGLNKNWKEKLDPAILKYMQKRDHHLRNFPFYKTVFQNGDQMFQLHPEQINLLANMWYYALTEKTELQPVLRSFAQ